MFGELVGESLVTAAKILGFSVLTGAGATIGFYGAKKGLEYMELIEKPAGFNDLSEALAEKAATIMAGKLKKDIDGVTDSVSKAIGAAAGQKLLNSPATTPATTPVSVGAGIDAAEASAFRAIVSQLADKVNAIQASSAAAAADAAAARASVEAANRREPHTQSHPQPASQATHRPAPSRASGNPRLEPST